MYVHVRILWGEQKQKKQIYSKHTEKRILKQKINGHLFLKEINRTDKRKNKNDNIHFHSATYLHDRRQRNKFIYKDSNC